MSGKKSRRRRRNNQVQSPEATQPVAIQQPSVMPPVEIHPQVQPMIVQGRVEQVSFKSPIPPAQFFEQYNGVIEGGSDSAYKTAIALLREESQHIRNQDARALEAQISMFKRGQSFAFGIAIASLAAAAYIVQFSTTVAGICVTVGIGTLAVGFLGFFKKQQPDQKTDQQS